MAPRQALTLHHKVFFLQVFHSRGSANLRDVADRLSISKSTLASIINDKDRVMTVSRSTSNSSEHEPEGRLSLAPAGAAASPTTRKAYSKQRWASLGNVATPSRRSRREDGTDDPHYTEKPPTRQELLKSLSTLRRVIECLEDAPLWYTFALDDLFLSCFPAVSRWKVFGKIIHPERGGKAAWPPERKDVLDAVWTIQRAFRNSHYPVWFSFAVNRLFQCYLWR